MLNNPLYYTDPSGFIVEGGCLGPWRPGGASYGSAIGRGSSRPKVGVAQTKRFGGGGGSSISVGVGPPRDCAGPECAGGGFGPVAAGFGIWSATSSGSLGDVVVSYTPYAGAIADDTGESAGGAVASGTIAGYEQHYVGGGFLGQVWDQTAGRIFGPSPVMAQEAYPRSGPREDWVFGREGDADETENWFRSGRHTYSRISPPICMLSNPSCTYARAVDALNRVGVHPNQTVPFDPNGLYVGDVDLPGPFGADHVMTRAIFNENDVQIGVRNQTLEDHLLHNGAVQRTIIERNGALYISTRGVGNGIFGGPNVWLDDLVWGAVDDLVIDELD